MTRVLLSERLDIYRASELARYGPDATRYTAHRTTAGGGVMLTPPPGELFDVTGFAASGPATFSAQTRVGDLFRVECVPTPDTTGLTGKGIELFVDPTDGCQLWAFDRTDGVGIPLTFQGGPMTFTPAVTFDGAVTVGGALTAADADVIVSANAFEGVQWQGVARLRWDNISALEATNPAANAYVDFGAKDIRAHGQFGANGNAPVGKQVSGGTIAGVINGLIAIGLFSS